jgi:hypothetical protein
MPPALSIALRVEFRAKWSGEFCIDFRVENRVMAIALLGLYTPPAGQMFQRLVAHAAQTQ